MITVPAAHAIVVSFWRSVAAFYLPETAIPAFIATAPTAIFTYRATGKIARFTPAGVLTEFRLTD